MWSGTIILLNMFNELASYIQSCGKISIFAPEMKKFTHIMLSLLLSLALLFIGSGVNITRCAHTGTVKMMTVFSNGAMSDMSCSMNSGTFRAFANEYGADRLVRLPRHTAPVGHSAKLCRRMVVADRE